MVASHAQLYIKATKLIFVQNFHTEFVHQNCKNHISKIRVMVLKATFAQYLILFKVNFALTALSRKTKYYKGLGKLIYAIKCGHPKQKLNIISLHISITLLFSKQCSTQLNSVTGIEHEYLTQI